MESSMHKYSWRIFLLPLLAVILSSCGGSSNSPSSNSTTAYTIGGTITGANSAIIVVNDTGAENPDIVSANNSFSFSALPQSGACYTSGCAYAVRIVNQPTGQVCSVTNAIGNIGSANVTNIVINCTTSPQTVAYSFSGLSDGGQPNSGLSQGSDGNFYGVSASGGDYGFGSFYKFNTSTLQTTRLYSFGPSDGQTPQSGLTQACDGNWYGTTTSGGLNGSGTFYKITSNGTSAGTGAVFYSLGSNIVASNIVTPQGLTIDTTSCPTPLPTPYTATFYGTSTSGGANGAGTIFSITSAGVKSVLYSFGASATDGVNPQAGLARGTDGNYYGTTGGGGAYGYGTFFQYNPITAQTVLLYSFGGTSIDGQYPDQKPLQGTDGNFYGTTSAGGSNGVGIIYKIVPSSRTESVFYTFQGGATDGATPSSRLKIGTDGNFYGLTFAGGYFDNGTFYQITPAGVFRLLYSFAGVDSGDGELPDASLLQDVNGIWWGTTVSGGTSGQGTIFSIRVTP